MNFHFTVVFDHTTGKKTIEAFPCEHALPHSETPSLYADQTTVEGWGPLTGKYFKRTRASGTLIAESAKDCYTTLRAWADKRFALDVEAL